MMIGETLEILLIRAQTGDVAAFGAIVEQFQTTVYAIAVTRLRDTHEAAELTQDVFIHAQRKLGQLRDLACFSGWLRQITVRMALNRLTRGNRTKTSDPEILQQTPGREVSPLGQLMAREARTEVWEGLGELKPLDRETLVAFYIRGQTLRQMSRDFATPVGTIKRRLHVARNRLRDVLEQKADATTADFVGVGA